MSKAFDLVLFGATGFTGRQTFLHLLKHAPATLRWAIGGRSRSRLAAMQKEAGHMTNPPAILIADSDDAASVETMVKQTQVLIQLAGPYARSGEAFVAACVKHGSDYIDLTAELIWVKGLIDKYHATAIKNKSRIIPVCGYEALPFDLGAFLAAKELQRRHGVPATGVDIIATLSGPGSLRPADIISGGTVASIKAILDSSTGKALADPGYLVQAPKRHKQIQSRYPYQLATHFEARVNAWVGPTVPAPFVNVPVAYRTVELLGDSGLEASPFADDYHYSESMSMGSFVSIKPAQRVMAEMMSQGFKRMLRISESNSLLAKSQRRASIKFLDWFAPDPGEGPSERMLEQSSYTLDILARGAQGEEVTGRGIGLGHPGYRSTAMIVAEVGMTLALGQDALPARYGLLTPASALEDKTLTELERGGLSYSF